MLQSTMWRRHLMGLADEGMPRLLDGCLPATAIRQDYAKMRLSCHVWPNLLPNTQPELAHGVGMLTNVVGYSLA